MKIAIVGAGAIGGYLGARLALAGEEVTCIARGPNLAAIQANGLKLIEEDGTERHAANVKGAQKMADVGAQDVVLLTLKAHQVKDVLPDMRGLFGPDTVVVTMQNGIPWWYFRIGAGEFSHVTLNRVDPGGAIDEAIPAGQVIGSLVYLGTEVVEPGVIRHTEGNRISLGEPDGSRSVRVKAVAGAFIKSGLRAPVTARLRHEIWVKLLGNIAFNPLSALTRATLAGMARDSDVRGIAAEIMREVEAVASKLGLELPITIEQRIAGAEKVGEHKTSMLQDLEAGRPLELEAVVGAAVELGERLGIPMPHTRTVYACTKCLDSTVRR